VKSPVLDAIDPDLAEIVDAWPLLSDDARVNVMQLVRSSHAAVAYRP